ncbi:MAG: DUF4255 domain-containing protein [Chloroflexi bacterium]|nr:DUF4255 domain-containing protein [Chloroflexota bacterium]
MINDLDETLKALLLKKAALDPSEVDISFDIPTREWSTPVTRPTVNLYLFDIRENRQLREMDWDVESGTNGQVTRKRIPVRIDVSYMITCWTSAAEDQHRLLWRVLETLFRHSPLPDDVLVGDMRRLQRPARTEVAQPDGILKNVSDFWGALENQLRPAINLVVTLELDLNQVTVSPMVFAQGIKLGMPVIRRDNTGREYYMSELRPGWELLPLRLAGIVRDPKGQPVAGVSVRIVGQTPRGPEQFGPTVETDASGRYLFGTVPAGEYTLIVEAAGQAPKNYPFAVKIGERGQIMPAFIHEVEVAMAPS